MMHKAYRMLPFFLVCMMPVMPASHRAALQGHLKGAVIGAAIGDALGRIGERFKTRKELCKEFGPKGLASFHAFKENHWAYDARDNEFALLSHHSILAFLLLDTLIYGRLQNLDGQTLLDLYGNRVSDRYGPNARTLDPYFEERISRWGSLECERFSRSQFDERRDTLWFSKMGSTDEGLFRSSGLVRAWPYGLVFYDDGELITRYVTTHMLLTHRDITMRSAAVALAVGIAHAVKGYSADDIVNQMVQAAEQFDELEKYEKPYSRKVHSFDHDSGDLISENLMLTSDLIRYAQYCAKKGYQPEEILGTNRKTNQHNRSPYNFLLGYEPDEALAAAVYVFVRHSADLKKAIIEGANAAGCSALIGSLSGALTGAYSGIRQLLQDDFDCEVRMIERVNELQVMANNLFVILCDAPSYCPQKEKTIEMRLSQ